MLGGYSLGWITPPSIRPQLLQQEVLDFFGIKAPWPAAPDQPAQMTTATTAEAPAAMDDTEAPAATGHIEAPAPTAAATACRSSAAKG